MKRKLSFRRKDRIDNEDFGDINKKKSGKLPKGMPTEIFFSTESEGYDDEVSCESQFKDVPDLVSAETPIQKALLPSSESSSSEQKTTAWVQSLPHGFQSLPDRFQSLQNSLFANRKRFLAVAAAALVCSQVPETTKLQLSVFAAGLSSTIMEQSKTLVAQKPPKATRKKRRSVTNTKLLEESQGIVTGESSRYASENGNNSFPNHDQGSVSETSESKPTDRITVPEDSISTATDQEQRAVPPERNPVVIKSRLATLQDDSDVNIDNFNGGAHGYGIVASQVRRTKPETNENVVVVQSNIMVQQDGTNTIIVQNNIVIPEGSKSTIILQSNIEGASMQTGTNGHLPLATPRAMVNGMAGPLDELELQQLEVVAQPADDELPPECYNVFKKFLNRDCHRTSGETESKERDWIESLLIDDWILNMDI